MSLEPADGNPAPYRCKHNCERDELMDRIAAIQAEVARKDEALREMLTQFDEGCSAIGGCSDGSCTVSRPKGVHTNGGCRCYDDRDRMRRFTQKAAYFREKVRAALEARND